MSAITDSISPSVLLWVLAIVLVLALVGLGVWWWRKSKRPSATAKVSLERELEAVWRPFYRSLPRGARYYPTVIVLGDAGAGKSQLIDQYVDWRGQANEFLPGAVSHAGLTLYLGPGLIVHELGAALLRNVSPEAHNALSSLWKQLGEQPATVVIALHARALQTSSPDALKELAQLIRGKLHLIAANGRTVDVRLCITNLHTVPGYRSLARLLASRGEVLELDLGAMTAGDADGINHLLGRFDAYVSLALTECSASEFRQVLTFFDQAPVMFSRLTPFLRGLAGEDPFAPRYSIQNLYASGQSRDEGVGDPFAVDRSIAYDSAIEAKKRIYRTCAAIGIPLLALVVFFFGRHWYFVSEADAATERYQVTPAESERARAEGDLHRLTGDEGIWLSRTFPHSKDRIEAAYVDTLRTMFVAPAVKQATERDALLAAVALLYASQDSELGSLIRPRLDKWQRLTRIPRAVIADYIDYSQTPWTGEAELPPIETWDLDSVPDDWERFLTMLRGAFVRGKLTPEELDALAEATPVMTTDRTPAVLNEIVEAIKRESRIPPETAAALKPLLNLLPIAQWIADNYQSLRHVTHLVQTIHLKVPPMAGKSMLELLEYIAMLSPEQQTKPETASTQAPAGGAERAPAEGAEAAETANDSQTAGTAETAEAAEDAAGAPADPAGNGPAAAARKPAFQYEFRLDGEVWGFDDQDFHQLVAQSRAALMIADFQRDVVQSRRSPFFAATTYFPAIGAFPGTAQGPTEVIDGIYTKQAYTASVAPALQMATTELDSMPLHADDEKLLSAFILASTESYATEYRLALESYYDSFRFSSPSADALVFELQALARPSSWLSEFLRIVAQNASIDMGGGPYFAPMAEAMRAFAPLVALMAEKDGLVPGLQPYTQIIEGVLAKLAPGTGDAPATAQSGLSLLPIGSFALEVLQGKQPSPVTQARTWLATVQLSSAWQRPFLLPLEQVMSFGRSDIERALASFWQEQVVASLAPVLARFPFARSASAEVSPEDVQAIFAPKEGKFWQAFAEGIEPLCETVRGQWRMRWSLKAPKGMLDTINSVNQFAAALWDADGKPQALTYQLRPLPLSADPIDGQVPTMAYLSAGEKSVYGFNQKPERTTLALDWWAQGTATVGVQVSDPKTGKRKEYWLTEGDSAWTLFRLLRRADRRRTPAAAWYVPVGRDQQGERRTVEVRFAVERDPWTLFPRPEVLAQ